LKKWADTCSQESFVQEFAKKSSELWSKLLNPAAF